MTLEVIYFHRSVVGIKCKDGVVFGVEKLVKSKLYELTSNRRIFTIDTHVGMVRQHLYDNHCSLDHRKIRTSLTIASPQKFTSFSSKNF